MVIAGAFKTAGNGFFVTVFSLIIFSLSAGAAPASSGEPYIWPTYNPTLNYNFRDEFPDLKEPVKDLDDCNEVGTIADRWWTFKWGSSKNQLVTESAIKPLLARMNKDFAYFRDTMGWPPDKRAKNGYRSAVYLYGSGLCTDDKPNTEKGGWQSTIGAYPMVLLSYYPVYSFDPACTYTDRESQMSACVHEGIHSILADLPGCKQSAWFQEGGNTWLQQQASAQQTNDYREMGFLNGTSFLAPFIPVECYSGWLQDGSFGGPSAEGVDKFEGTQQICTWRTFLGGHQYGNIFPTFLGEWLGLGSVPWVWRNCPGRVLEGISKKLGDEQTRRLIIEYRARQALIDMGKWSSACKAVLDARFGSSIGPEWEPYWIACEMWKATPYAKTTNDGTGLLTPEQRTTPGWSGANQIPLTATGTFASVDFRPIGANMSCQLCYRSTDGTPVYSVPVTNGICSIRLDKAPNKNVIIAVICNTDYIYKGDSTRKAHFDYWLKIEDGISGTADIYTKWYDAKLVTSASPLPQSALRPSSQRARSFTVKLNGTRQLILSYTLSSSARAGMSIFSASGELVKSFAPQFKGAGNHEECYRIGDEIPAGVYVLRLLTDGNHVIGSTNIIIH